jgi:formylglycine-generating enzyme required for sulfatase activity
MGRLAWHSILPLRLFVKAAITASFFLILSAPTWAEKPAVAKPLPIADAYAKSAGQMKPYTELIEHTEAKIEMVPIPGGKFTMGSPDSEADRKKDEGPQHEVEIAPFWMAKVEMTWDAYEVWMYDTDILRRKLAKTEINARDTAADEYQTAQPTRPYTDMTFSMGRKGYPAICMTQLAARTYCQWLSQKTGRYYRLPTEAEWEYACRAGTQTAYSFGDELDDQAWYYDNSDEKYQKVGKKKPNAWGLYDMHGNVSEWVLDAHGADSYEKRAGKAVCNPLVVPQKLYGRVVRGGSWDDDPDMLRSAARTLSVPAWKQQDPQFPKSIWYHTDALHVGFRIVRPLAEPSDKEKASKWDKSEPVQDRKKGR